MTEILDTNEAAAESRRHRVTIRKALEASELHGFQRQAGGRWSIRRACLDAWIENRPCEHQQQNVTAIRRRRA